MNPSELAPFPSLKARSFNLSPGKSFILAALLLAAGLCIYFSLYMQAVPYETDGGIGAWITAKDVSWPRMFGYLLNPVTQRDRAGHFLTIVNVRVVESMIYKGLYDLFGDALQPATVYVIVVSMVFGLSVLWLVRRATGSTLAGFLCAVFLAATPAYGWCVMEHGDHSPSDQILLIAYLAMFLPLILRMQTETESLGHSTAGRITRLAALWLIGMIAIRAKETNKFLVPILSWAMVGWVLLKGKFQQEGWYTKMRSVGWLAVVLVLLTLPIVLVQNPSHKPLVQSQFLFFPFYMLVWNPYGWQSEPTSALLTMRPMFPVSLASTLGFFLSWSLIIAAVVYALNLFRERSKPMEQSPAIVSNIPWGFLFSVWLAVALSFSWSFNFLGLTRYVTIPLLPLSLLATWVFVCVLSACKPRLRPILRGLLVALIAIKAAENLKHSIYLRQELEGLWTPKWMIREAVYKDATKDEHPTLFKVYSYLGRSDGIPYPAELVTYLWHHNERKNLGDDVKFQDLLSRHGVAYVGSNKPLQLPWHSQQMLSIDGSRLSCFTTWYYRFTDKPRPTFYLTKIWI